MSITLNGTTGISTPDITSTTAPSLVGTNFTSLPSASLTGALPAISGSALTSLTSANLTGDLPAISGSSLTSLTSANLTGALPAIDGSALTGVGGSTDFGAVGTYILGYRGTTTPSTLSPGSTMAGSSLFNSNASGGGYTPTHSGTWRMMGSLPNSDNSSVRSTVWVRIS